MVPLENHMQCRTHYLDPHAAVESAAPIRVFFHGNLFVPNFLVKTACNWGVLLRAAGLETKFSGDINVISLGAVVLSQLML
jgi:hypothetical protein